jgi:hypothetical protein
MPFEEEVLDATASHYYEQLEPIDTEFEPDGGFTRL